MFSMAEIKEIKKRAQHQQNWSANTVLRLINNIESLEKKCEECDRSITPKGLQ